MAIGGSPIPTCSLTHLKGISYLNHQTCPGESRGDRPYYKSSRLSQGNLYVSYQKQGKIRLQVFMMERPSAAGRPALAGARKSINNHLPMAMASKRVNSDDMLVFTPLHQPLPCF